MKRHQEKANEKLIVTIVNETNSLVDFGELLHDYHNASGSGGSTSGVVVPAQSSVVLDLTVKSHCKMESIPPDPIVSWSLRLRKPGFRFKTQTDEISENQELNINVIPGGIYVIVEDITNPYMTQEEKDMVTKKLLECLETHIPFNDIFPLIVKLLPDVVGQRTPNQLIKAYEGGGTLGNWRSWYYPIIPESWVTPEDVSIILSSNIFRLQIYYRALDRFPGGNADMHTLCFEFVRQGVTTGFVIKEHSNWDGSQCFLACRPQRKIRIDNLVETIFKVVPSVGINSECNLKDLISRDNEESDTEWSSQELLVFAPRKWTPLTHKFFSPEIRQSIKTFLLVNLRLKNQLPREVLHHLFIYMSFDPNPATWVPIFRVHRSAVMGEQLYSWAKKDNPEIPMVEPSPEQHAILNTVDSMLGMGRVNQWTESDEEEEPCKAVALRNQGKNLESWETCNQLPYLQPSYFRW